MRVEKIVREILAEMRESEDSEAMRELEKDLTVGVISIGHKTPSNPLFRKLANELLKRLEA